MNIKSQKNSAQKPTSGGRKIKTPKKITETYLHNSGLYYLQRYASSAQNFRRVMLRKVKKSCLHHTDQNYEDCEKMVEALVEKFCAAGLLNDELYTEGMVNSLRRSGKSRRAVLMKMKEKGISDDLTQKKLQNHEEHQAALNTDPDNTIDPELRAAVKTARKRRLGPFRTKTPDDTDKQNERDLAALARAGFPFDICKKALEIDKEDAEEILHRFF